jgi:Bacterial low temperature requirement A protein (LtrA)
MTQPLTQPHLSSRWKSPRLRINTDGEESNHASWVELFFDLVFVVAIAELSHTLEQHLSWHGFIQFAALFLPCWWAWVLVTFYVDRYETDDPTHRILILSTMLAVIFLANGNCDRARVGISNYRSKSPAPRVRRIAVSAIGREGQLASLNGSTRPE